MSVQWNRIPESVKSMIRAGDREGLRKSGRAGNAEARKTADRRAIINMEIAATASQTNTQEQIENEKEYILARLRDEADIVTDPNVVDGGDILPNQNYGQPKSY